MNIELQKIMWPKKSRIVLMIAIAIGIITFAIGLSVDAQRAWANFLLEYYFWLCVSVAGVFFVALQHITASSWSASIRRIPETFLAYLPVSFLLFLVLAFGGLHHLYEWTHHDVVATDHLLTLKKPYLNETFFALRQILFYLFAFGTGYWMTKNSLRQDITGDPHLTKLNTKIAAPFLLVFAWGFSFISFDLMMSLSPHWFSTIFGIYCWAILFLSGLSMMTIIVILLHKAGYLREVINENHYHDLGKLLFAFLVFWAYIAFSQFMLIWYANLPEETMYMIPRVTGSWKIFSFCFIAIKFVVPFFTLISRKAKRNQNILLAAAIWIFCAQWIDIYWLVFPTFFDAPVFGWIEIGLFIGFAGLFFLSVGSFFTRVSPVAVKDPYLAEGLHLHQ
ncbi:MAG: hypothetical protein A3I05_02180 [Deltaproteobacteria bacterium RIFCSPLOWO2_02_FULL_44_10]|nr:MAG: hypothetical protein A3C46_08345 [Deltaproteobacteria bacterium RIFCSPHIGHO2_02_FULL_44_16]OGQ47586.1 MAG: hypothetical protein A3I05_02180 [Deltaproteobacteria bacterium RIFCSPLOWO2_02_FULL_44_10]